MDEKIYKRLAERLDALPNSYPPTEDGADLRLLAKLFSPEQAELASHLRMTLETSKQIAARSGGDPKETKIMLKKMVKEGLIKAGRAEGGLGFGLLPFAIGIYEYQFDKMDAEMARLFEDYYQQTFTQALTIQPQLTRIVPIGEEIRKDMEVRPYERAMDVVDNAKAWGVLDCICRKQKTLIGDPCHHPLDVCLSFSQFPNAFDGSDSVKALTKEEAAATLRRASDAGLVHQVSNNQEGLWFVCNCCTCSCGILRGMSEMGIANVVARSAFVNQVEVDLCIACDLCVEYCQFDALTLAGEAQVDEVRCVGCGVCVPACPEGALGLARRPEEDILPIPVTEEDWGEVRAAHRGLDMGDVR